MFYCTGVNQQKNNYLIYDTDDNGTELVSYWNLVGFAKQGVTVSNLQLGDNKWNITDTSFIDSQLELFKSKGNVALTKMIVMRKDIEEQKKILSELAAKLGLIPKGTKLSIDINTGKVIFPWQGFIYTFRGEDTGSKIEKIDVCNEKVVELSKLGFDAFNYMMLNLGTKQQPIWVNLRDCFHELKSYDSRFDENYINYIGITPSNRMFKIYFYNDMIYSVQFCTFNDLNSNYDKILKLGTTDSDFAYYVRSKIYNNDKDGVCICKVSRKTYKASISKLKEKYSTLQDVFVRR